jgi:hypothetical protein
MPKSRNSKSYLQRRRQGSLERLQEHMKKDHLANDLERHQKEVAILKERLS